MVGLLAVTLSALLAACPGRALALAPLIWGSPTHIDEQPPFSRLATITGVACPSRELCVAVDNVGDVLVSTDPAGGPATWSKRHLTEQFEAVSCPSAHLCLAVDTEGDVFSSTDPTGGVSAWNRARISEHNGFSLMIEDVSCPSTRLCVAVGRAGILVSSEPTGGAATWSTTKVSEGGLSHVSCPNEHLCVAIDNSSVFTASDPLGGAAAWHGISMGNVDMLTSVSCAGETVCVAGDLDGQIWISDDPLGETWRAIEPGGTATIQGISCTSVGFCIALQENKVLTSTDPTGGASAWHAAVLETGDERGGGPPRSFESVACVSMEFCVAGGQEGLLASASTPTGGVGAWAVADLQVGSNWLRGVSCAPSGLCVAVDYAGNVVASTDPGGGAREWGEAHIDSSPFAAVSCASGSLCVAVDEAGHIFSSTDPTGGSGAWHGVTIEGVGSFTGVSCVPEGECVATAYGGSVVSSDDPAGGAAAWHTVDLPESGLRSVSCASAHLCVAVLESYGIVTSTEPLAARVGAWRPTSFPEALLGVSCPSAELCVAVGRYNAVLSSTSPAGGAQAWHTTYFPGPNGLLDVSCASSTLCVSTSYGVNSSPGNVIESTEPLGDTASWFESEAYGGVIVNQNPILELFGEFLTGISCVGNSCAAVDINGNVIVGSRWPPADTQRPRVSGTASPGQVLVCAGGSWSGYPAPVLAYQWLRDGVAIPGADGDEYEVQQADQGDGLACQVTGENTAGKASASSRERRVPPAPSQTEGSEGNAGGNSGGDEGALEGGTPRGGTLGGPAGASFRLDGIKRVPAKGAVKLALTFYQRGTLRVVGSTHVSGGHNLKVLAVRLSRVVARPRQLVIGLTLSDGAEALLATRGRLAVDLTITYKPTNGGSSSISKSVVWVLKSAMRARRKRSTRSLTGRG